VFYINKNLSKNDRAGIYDRAINKDHITKHMKVQEFLSYKAPCPLLKNGICMVYEVRPMACRTYLSSSSTGCKTEYDHPKEIDIFPDLYEFPIRAGRMINEGISAYLIENQISPTEWLIESSLHTAMTDDRAFERWLKGKNIFQKRNYSDEEIRYLNSFGADK
jgi:Fe-S-cluster containining protein